MSKAKTKDKPKDQAKTKNVLLPSPMRMVWGALAAYYLRDIIHPAFTLIAVMILLMIPILIANMLFPPPKIVALDESEVASDDNEEEVAESI
ncbi:MAG: hypothetical protein IBX55_20760 [Methyloprofundus sp.]|nr:hypothetical protein [Methyloprofundus sp.]